MFSRYASLRRQLLIDPHVWKDGSSSPDLVMDNPLSQNPGDHSFKFYSLFQFLVSVEQSIEVICWKKFILLICWRSLSHVDSMWGRFFKNAELERMVDQDLTRLYPEHGSYFQTSACQGILRRILLLWCLRYPDYGYRQGLLNPLISQFKWSLFWTKSYFIFLRLKKWCFIRLDKDLFWI